jgi:hypothetical protein
VVVSGSLRSTYVGLGGQSAPRTVQTKVVTPCTGLQLVLRQGLQEYVVISVTAMVA